MQELGNAALKEKGQKWRHKHTALKSHAIEGTTEQPRGTKINRQSLQNFLLQYIDFLLR